MSSDMEKVIVVFTDGEEVEYNRKKYPNSETITYLLGNKNDSPFIYFTYKNDDGGLEAINIRKSTINNIRVIG